MVRITVQGELEKQLSTASELVEFIDASGKLIGRFLPERDTMLEGWEPVMPSLSPEEIKTRMNSSEPAFSMQEVKAILRKRS